MNDHMNYLIEAQLFHRFNISQHTNTGLESLACHAISTDRTVEVPELSNPIEQTVATNIPQLLSNLVQYKRQMLSGSK